MACCGGKETLLLACSGGSNVGQIANDCAKRLDVLGWGKLYCALGIAQNLPGFVDRAKAADERVVIDGCEEHCARKALESSGVKVDLHMVLTDMGIKKSRLYDYPQEIVTSTSTAIMMEIGK